MPPYLDDTANTDPCFMMALPVSLPGHGGGRALPMLPGNETRCLLASLPDHMGGEKAFPTWPGNRARCPCPHILLEEKQRCLLFRLPTNRGSTAEIVAEERICLFKHIQTAVVRKLKCYLSAIL